MPFNLKHGVLIHYTPEIAQIATVLDDLLHKHGQHATFTSGLDGEHSAPRYHRDCADFRTLDPRTGKELYPVAQVAKDLQTLLGPGFRVINEGDHLHVQTVKK